MRLSCELIALFFENGRIIVVRDSRGWENLNTLTGVVHENPQKDVWRVE
jgi:hypothetical protein